MKFTFGWACIVSTVLTGAACAETQVVDVAPSPKASATASELYIDPGLALTGAGAADYKNSFSLDIGDLRSFHQIASAGWEIGYLFGSRLEGTGFTSDTHVKIFHLSPEIKLGPSITVGSYAINPYILGGGGLYWSHQNDGTLTTDSGAMAPVSSYDHVNGGWNIGLGTSVSLPGDWSVGFDLRRHEVVYRHGTDFTWITPALRFALQFS